MKRPSTLSVHAAWLRAALLERWEFSRLVARINALEPRQRDLRDYQLRASLDGLQRRSLQGEALDALLPEAFALVRETARRIIGLRHHDAQLIGGVAIHRGCIAEMQTGEGKTLVATLPACLNALTGKGVHVVTVNDYLARRDAGWMGPIYQALGLSVGVLQNGLPEPQRQAAYRCDITYGTNKEFAFDFLRDSLRRRARKKGAWVSTLENTLARLQWQDENLLQRPHHYAIVDEVDSILIDEARTPLIISGPGGASLERARYQKADWLARQLQVGPHFAVDRSQRRVKLTAHGLRETRGLVGRFFAAADLAVDWEKPVALALQAHHLHQADHDYIVRDGKICIVDEFTGRILADRQWSEGLHQAVQAKEGVNVLNPFDELARTTYQNYFRLYSKLSGMTGTARTAAGEFRHVYGLRVVTVPTHHPLRRTRRPDRVFADAAAKLAAVCDEITRIHETGRPILVGTRSIDVSERLGGQLRARGIPHEVLNAKNDEAEAGIVAGAGQRGRVTIATNLAGRGTDIKLGEGLAGLGGLHVIGTERHEAERIDLQLLGRAARQGDPGSGQFFVSLEDDLFLMHQAVAAETLAQKILAEAAPGQASAEARTPWLQRRVRWFVERAQNQVTAYHLHVRRALLRYDDFVQETFRSFDPG